MNRNDIKNTLKYTTPKKIDNRTGKKRGSY